MRNIARIFVITGGQKSESQSNCYDKHDRDQDGQQIGYFEPGAFSVRDTHLGANLAHYPMLLCFIINDTTIAFLLNKLATDITSITLLT